MNWNNIVEPIVNLIESIVDPLLVIVGALGLVYCIYLGVKLAVAGTREDRHNATVHLITAVVAYFLIFILIYLLKAYTPALKEFVNGNTDGLLNTTVDITQPINDAIDNAKDAKDGLENNTTAGDVTDAVNTIIENGEAAVENVVEPAAEEATEPAAEEIAEPAAEEAAEPAAEEAAEPAAETAEPAAEETAESAAEEAAEPATEAPVE